MRLQKRKLQNDFTKAIKEWLIDTLTNNGVSILEKKSADVYELSTELTMDINTSGSIWCNADVSKEFIFDNTCDFDDLNDFYKSNFGESLNGFADFEKNEVIAYIFGCEILLSRIEDIDDILQLQNKQDIIDLIIERLENDDEDIFFN